MLRFPYVFALPLLLAGLAVSSPQQPPADLISVNVDLVVLQATVRDHKGNFASDLREQDFEVYEGGIRQSIQFLRHEDVPVTVGLVVDHSGSMRPKLSDVIAAAETFVQASSPKDEMFVINFNEKVTIGLPNEIPFTSRFEELARAISNAPVTGQTALYDAVLTAQHRLATGHQDKKVLIIISDGGDNSSKHRMEDVIKTAEQSTALIYTIGIFDDADADRNPAILRRLAAATGGEAYFPGHAAEVVTICERIARDIRHQYTLGYAPSHAAQPGAFRPIQVVARDGGKTKLVVRTRSGYIAGGEPPLAKDEPAK